MFLDQLQKFLLLDDPSFRFLGIFITFFGVLYFASFLFGKLKPVSQPRLNKTAKPSAIVDMGLKTGRAFVKMVANMPVSPNQVTAIGLLLVMFNCGLFIIYENTFWFGTGLISALLFDTLDGLVARAQGTSSKFGGYLDATVDRYQELVIYVSIGLVLDQFLLAFLVMTGSMLTSYNKARASMEVETTNKGWPDLLERPVRLFILCVGLIGAGSVVWFLPLALWMLVVMTHFTALQRLVRAYFIISDEQSHSSIENTER